mmetsp:Transcript_28062/g.71114  ORF Transcript_28062/g.71114 Transcript_28062/m.71114 type:complete len:225 (+) Transcript_28062:315-989(+)
MSLHHGQAHLASCHFCFFSCSTTPSQSHCRSPHSTFAQAERQGLRQSRPLRRRFGRRPARHVLVPRGQERSLHFCPRSRSRRRSLPVQMMRPRPRPPERPLARRSARCITSSWCTTTSTTRRVGGATSPATRPRGSASPSSLTLARRYWRAVPVDHPRLQLELRHLRRLMVHQHQEHQRLQRPRRRTGTPTCIARTGTNVSCRRSRQRSWSPCQARTARIWCRR